MQQQMSIQAERVVFSTNKGMLQEARDRIEMYGPRAISNTELLAVIVGADPASLQNAYPTLTHLYRASITEMSRIVSKDRARRIKAAFELAARMAVEGTGRPQITSPADAANILMPSMGMLEQEHVIILNLDTKMRVIEETKLYIGDVNASFMRPAETFRAAIRCNATCILIAHNHPSGDPTPSQEDVQTTRHIVEAGRIIDVQVMDHIIVGRGRWVSLKERGLGFED